MNLREDFLDVLGFMNRWPDDARFADHAGYFLSKLGGLMGEW